MNEYQDAAEHARSAASLYRKFVAVADLLDKAGSFQQAAEDAERRLNDARTAEARAKASLDTIMQSIEVAKGEAERVIADANAEAERIEKEADQNAEAIREAAETAANDTSMRIISDAKAAQERAERMLAQTRSEIADENRRLMALRGEIDAKSQQIDNLNAALAELRAKLG